MTDSEGAKNVRPRQAGTKRLFSDRASHLLNSQDYDENNQPNLSPDETHEGKRSRGSDWPLPRTIPINVEPQHHVQNDGCSSKQRSLTPVRGSRFVEGSMNDRASKMPPREFTGEDNMRETYARHLAKSRTAQQTSASGSIPDKSETARHSGIFRFGKSLAASFNLQNWKLWSKQQEPQDEMPQQRALRERQEKAERIYAELKRTGNFRDSAIPPFFRAASDDIAVKHDSGIAFDRTPVPGLTSQEDKRRGRIFIDPPILPTDDDESHSTSEPSSTAPRSLLTKPPRSLRPSRSRPQDARSQSPKPRTRTRRRSLSVPRLRKPSTQVSESDDPGRSSPRVQRASSRPNLRKHRRLVKRVSNLETKLAAARQQLLEAASEPLPSPAPAPATAERVSRQRFVPGALATLPSERLLSGYTSGDGTDAEKMEEEEVQKIGRAVSKDYGERREGFEWPDYVF